MNDALVRGDSQAALTYLDQDAATKYGEVFSLLLSDMPSIVASYSPLWGISISQSTAQYAIIRLIDGPNRVFMVYFIKDVDGVWRLDGM